VTVAGNRDPAAERALRDEVAAIKWFHTIELAPGLTTPGLDPTHERLDILKMPESLAGRSVLDVGAWDGFFSFEAERRGAKRVVAADSFAWNADNWSNKNGFELARRTLGSAVEDVEVDVMDLSPEQVGQFDLVLFLGVLYHLRHPLLALERLASVTADQLILETHIDLTWTRRPAMAFYPGLEVGWDPTNWWGPNPEAVVAMLKSVGFSDVRVVTPDTWPYRLGRMARRTPQVLRFMAEHHVFPIGRLAQGRAVFHARK
jgi:tRNA (mo5U34)-methyltransferase